MPAVHASFIRFIAGHFFSHFPSALLAFIFHYINAKLVFDERPA